jgi:hypothetical protein
MVKGSTGSEDACSAHGMVEGLGTKRGGESGWGTSLESGISAKGQHFLSGILFGIDANLDKNMSREIGKILKKKGLPSLQDRASEKEPATTRSKTTQ